MMKIESIVVAGIDVGDRLRQVNQKKVDEIARSMSEVGLLNPITLKTPDDRNVQLVAGAHRLQAAKDLGWDEIDAIILDCDEITSQLAEIDENLCRSELTPTQESEHLARRKELWEAREQQDAEVGGTTCPTQVEHDTSGRVKSQQQQEGFATNTAKTTGKTKKSINRAIKRANEVTQQARDLVRGTKLDTGAYLDKLTKVDPGQQVSMVEQDLEVLEDKERRDELRKEREDRDREAKELRKAARDECCSYLHSKLDAREWGYLIDVVERSGGSIRADDLRNWEAPAARGAA